MVFIARQNRSLCSSTVGYYSRFWLILLLLLETKLYCRDKNLMSIQRDHALRLQSFSCRRPNLWEKNIQMQMGSSCHNHVHVNLLHSAMWFFVLFRQLIITLGWVNYYTASDAKRPNRDFTCGLRLRWQAIGWIIGQAWVHKVMTYNVLMSVKVVDIHLQLIQSLISTLNLHAGNTKLTTCFIFAWITAK